MGSDRDGVGWLWMMNRFINDLRGFFSLAQFDCILEDMCGRSIGESFFLRGAGGFM